MPNPASLYLASGALGGMLAVFKMEWKVIRWFVLWHPWCNSSTRQLHGGGLVMSISVQSCCAIQEKDKIPIISSSNQLHCKNNLGMTDSTFPESMRLVTACGPQQRKTVNRAPVQCYKMFLLCQEHLPFSCWWWIMDKMISTPCTQACCEINGSHLPGEPFSPPLCTLLIRF